jgi:hypothetical protein
MSPLVMRRTSPLQTHKTRRSSDTSTLSSSSMNAGIPEEEDDRYIYRLYSVTILWFIDLPTQTLIGVKEI